MIRESSLKGQLLRMGFVDVDLAGERLLGLGAAADPVVWMLGRAADPDLALGSLVDLIQACEDPTELIQTLTDDAELVYLHSTPYAPQAEGALNPRDPRLSIDWPLEFVDVSARDASHPMIDDTFLGVAP